MKRFALESKSRIAGRGAALLAAFVTLLLAGCGVPDAATSYARAEQSLARYDYREALIHARNALQAQPEHPRARVLLGRAALALGDLEEAEFQLRRAAQEGAPAREHAVPAAELRARTGDVGGALALLDTVDAPDRDAEYWLLRANVAMQAGELAEAEDALGRVEQSNSPALAVARSRFAQLRGDESAASAALQQALDADSKNPEALAMWAALAMDRQDLGAAQQALIESADIYESRGQALHAAPILMQLVQVQLAQGALDAAVQTSARLGRLIPNTVAAHYAAGLVALRQGNQQAAIESLRQAAAIAPGQAEIDVLLGGAYLTAGSLGQAEQHLLAALDAQGPTPNVVRLLAETRLRQGRAQAALDALARLDRQLVEQEPSLALVQGAAYVENGDAASAIPFLEIAVAAEPASATATLQLARAYGAAGRTDDAARLMRSSPAVSEDTAYSTNVALLVERFRSQGPEAAGEFVASLLQDAPQSASALLVAAMFEALRNDGARALRRVGEALAADQEFVPALLMAASLEADAGRPREAESYLERVLALESAHPAASLALARLRLVRDDQAGARSVLESAAAAPEAPAQVIAALGEIERQAGNVERAQEIARDLQQRFPRGFEGYSLEARIHEHAGRQREAATAYRAAYERRPTWAALQGAVVALRRVGDPGWESLLRDRVEREPADAASRLLLAEALQAEARAPEAMAEYERVIAVDGNNVVALNNAAWLLQESDGPRALSYAERALRLAPDSAAVLDTLGWVLVTQGRAAEAVPHLEKAAQSASDALDIRYHLAAAQARSGNPEAARRTLEALLAEGEAFASRGEAEALLRSL